MACSKCGGNHSGGNPLDCDNRFLGCNNPCGTSPANTAQCESLPSQIENFTLQFFGTVVKTEVDGRVTWSLPCGLDVGLPNNPRGVDEGLACYFLRLFSEGIIGLTGPKGDNGNDGAAGRNAYTIVAKGFNQPSLNSPQVQVVTVANPAIFPGLYIQIESSGEYLITETDGAGTLFVTLLKPVTNPPAFINSGKLVVPSGSPGATGVGAKGDKGDKGDQGVPGSTFTTNNGFYFSDLGTDYGLTATYAAVDFVNSSPQIFLSEAGQYLVTVVADLVGTASVVSTDFANLKLRDTTISGDIAGSEHSVSNFDVDERKQIVINVRVQTEGPNHTIALYGSATIVGHIDVVALHTTITFVRIE